MTAFTASRTTGWFSAADCSIDDFAVIVGQETQLSDYPYADAVDRKVLIYGEKLRAAIGSESGRRAVQTELIRALTDGPGNVVFKKAFGDLSVIDRATDAFFAQIAAEKAAGVSGGDHFAKPGANDRVWGALDKLAVADPTVFAEYYANDIIALVSQSWLGPNYQVTSQVNVVNPGGQAQTAHRDYHLGFMDAVASARFPAQVHRLSPGLTLQGAVAHCDMPIETGPTLYLPYSQQYEPGYLAFHLPEFTEYFLANYTQLPLEKGDAAFFNPALFHGAGTNLSATTRRMANLLQVVLAVRPRDGNRRPGRDVPRPVPGAAGAQGRRRVRGRSEQRHRRVRRGLRLPHQPRPRPADRRHRPADPGRPAPPGRRAGMDPGSLRGRPRRPIDAHATQSPTRRLTQ